MKTSKEVTKLAKEYANTVHSNFLAKMKKQGRRKVIQAIYYYVYFAALRSEGILSNKVDIKDSKE